MAAENSQMLKLAGGMAVGATALMMASSALKQSLKLGLEQWKSCEDDLCWREELEVDKLDKSQSNICWGLLDVRPI